MTVSLTSKFLSNARGITFKDGGGITWTFNANTNELTATGAGGAGIGTVTTVSVVTASGVSGSVANPSSTPAITLALGAITPSSVAASGTVTGSNLSGTNTGDQTIPTGANPATAKVGLAAVNGAAATFMRSDAAPPLDQAIAPTWSGAHAWSSTMAASANPLAAATTRVMTGISAVLTSDATFATATLANTSLSVTANEAGTYSLDAVLFYYEATAGTGGFKFDINGGSATLGVNLYAFVGANNNSAAFGDAQSFATATTFSTTSTAPATPSVLKLCGTVVVTVAGTIIIRGAQNSLLAIDPTHLVAGSYMTLTKIN